MPYLDSLFSKRGDVEFTYRGDVFHIVYDTDRATHVFQAEAMRLNREVLKMQRRQATLLQKATLVVADDGTIEAQAEDDAAEAAIVEMMQESDALKRKVDALLLSIVLEWDLLLSNGKPVPLTPEVLFPLPVDFEGDMLTAIIAATNVGEVNGAPQSTNSPLPSKPKDMPEATRQSQNGTTTSKQAEPSQP